MKRALNCVWPGINAPHNKGTAEKGVSGSAFSRTRVIGFSQVGLPRSGWFVTDGIFESIVGNDHWELLWDYGAGVDRWQNPDYAGWSRPLVSPCLGDAPVDRVVLSVSGPIWIR